MLRHIMARKLSAFFLVFLTVVLFSHADRGSSMRRKLAVKHHLKRVNKQPTKSISSPDGDIIDCVDIKNQPAFDLPALQNHTIQMWPSFHPEGLMPLKGDKHDGPTQLWHVSGKCPEGTVPIRRTSEADILRAESVERFGKKKAHSHPGPQSALPGLFSETGHEHAITYVEGGKYYGAKGTINVWQPEIQQSNEFSLSQIWLLAGTFGQDLNSIEAGWQVSPDLYGDSKTRLFTYWTSDAYQATGCYNLLCSGFVQISPDITIGGSIYPVSTFKGPQYEITLLIWKDPQGDNWWLQLGNKYVIGYWPGFLFANLAESATMVEWGGEVVNFPLNGQHTTTQMGSGHFPEEGYGSTAYFKNIQVVDASNIYRAPEGLSIFTEKPDCYNARKGSNGNWGDYFYFGGPGRNPNCP